jgi:hypothetical protein
MLGLTFGVAAVILLTVFGQGVAGSVDRPGWRHPGTQSIADPGRPPG